MSEGFHSAAWMPPIDFTAVEKCWRSEGFSFGIFQVIEVDMQPGLPQPCIEPVPHASVPYCFPKSLEHDFLDDRIRIIRTCSQSRAMNAVMSTGKPVTDLQGLARIIDFSVVSGN